MSREGPGKRHVNVILNVDDPTSFEVPISTTMETGSGSRLKKKKARTAHEKDPNYPPPRYTQFANEVCLQWYAGKSVQFLEANYLRDPVTGSELLVNHLSYGIRSRCNASEEFADVQLTYSNRVEEWLIDTAKNCIHNTKRLMHDLRPEVLGPNADDTAKEFCEKMEWWHIASKKLSSTKARGFAWVNNAVINAFAKDGGLCITWIPPSAKVEPLSGFCREGGHGKVRKVRIQGMNTIPSHIALAGKMPKTRNLRDARVERSVEALVCPLNHPAIIKFFAINAKTMEAYTLWWNGGHLGELQDLDKKVSPTVDWHEMRRVRGLPEEKQKELYLFRRHKAKLAWALVYVTHLMHQSLVLHNDLSPRNILLHYPDYSNDIVYIGICDWGIASRVDEKAPSHYGYQTEVELNRQKAGRYTVAPELFYTFGPMNSDTSLSIMQAKHVYTDKSDSYSIGKLTEWMRIGEMDEFDNSIFQNQDASRYFAHKLRQLTNEDAKLRVTCTEVTNALMSHPWNMKPPEVVFRDSPL